MTEKNEETVSILKHVLVEVYNQRGMSYEDLVEVWYELHRQVVTAMLQAAVNSTRPESEPELVIDPEDPS